MIRRRLRKTAVTFWAAVAATLFFAVAVPGTASAVPMRTITGRTTCNFNLPYGFYISYASPSGTDWTPWISSGISVIAIDSVSKTWTTTIPTTAGLFALDTFCYADQNEYDGRVFYGTGQYIGYTARLTPGTSSIQSTWSCFRGQGGFGFNGYVHSCTMTAAAYG
ncbi:MAG: hypothetical protein V7637_980 [Mycobacteriales bacterium]|jgi:hypothetical protein